jgi:hypothetical protein
MAKGRKIFILEGLLRGFRSISTGPPRNFPAISPGTLSELLPLSRVTGIKVIFSCIYDISCFSFLYRPPPGIPNARIIVSLSDDVSGLKSHQLRQSSEKLNSCIERSRPFLHRNSAFYGVQSLICSHMLFIRASRWERDGRN